MVHYLADHDVALFFGHASHEEALALAEEVQRIGFRKAVVDHPFSPIIDLDVPRLRQLAAAGVYLNWTYDELSPLLGVDPQDIVAAIEAIGPEHCLLSSNTGDPVLPHSVGAMRLLAATLGATGCRARRCCRWGQRSGADHGPDGAQPRPRGVRPPGAHATTAARWPACCPYNGAGKRGRGARHGPPARGLGGGRMLRRSVLGALAFSALSLATVAGAGAT